MLSAFSHSLRDRLTRNQLPLSRNPSPLRSSKFSFEYLLLPPRSALDAVPTGLTPWSSVQHVHALLLIATSHLSMLYAMAEYRRPAERHKFSELVHSAGELLHTP